MAKKVTLLFPGQGSQFVGMGKNLEGAREILAQVDEVLGDSGSSLSQLMLNGPEEDLTLTHNAQPAIVAHSYLLYRGLQKFLSSKNIQIDCLLGHSVGEYSALVVAESLSFEDAVRLTRLRGQFMQEATPLGVGKMVAILNVSGETVERVCREVSGPTSLVSPANFNAPTQTVISGHSDACDKVVAQIKQDKANLRAIPLSVSAPFHSPLMKPAALRLAAVLEETSFGSPVYPYIANWNAHLYTGETSPQQLRENLVKQVDASVLWSQSLSSVPDNTLCLECGPGRVLAGLARRINPTLRVLSLDEEGALEKLEELL